jgi:hypothetical protein
MSKRLKTYFKFMFLGLCHNSLLRRSLNLLV